MAMAANVGGNGNLANAANVSHLPAGGWLAGGGS